MLAYGNQRLRRFYFFVINSFFIVIKGIVLMPPWEAKKTYDSCKRKCKTIYLKFGFLWLSRHGNMAPFFI